MPYSIYFLLSFYKYSVIATVLKIITCLNWCDTKKILSQT